MDISAKHEKQSTRGKDKIWVSYGTGCMAGAEAL